MDWVILLCLMLAPGDYERGAALFAGGRYDEAIAVLARVSREHPSDARVWKALGVTYAAKADYALALDPLQRACALNPRLEDACYFEARALYALDRFEDSIAVLRAELPRDASPWRIHLGIAQASEALGRAAEAEPRFQNAMAMSPAGNHQAAVAYAHFLLRAGRLDSAEETLAPLVRAHPEAADAQLELGRVLYQFGRVPEAIAHLRIACRLMPGNQQARLLLDRAGRLQDSRTVK